jgi:hypothetical protein
MREHAAEFAEFSGMARLHSRQPINPIYYSQKFAWERRKLREELSQVKYKLTEHVIEHAQAQGVFFDQPDADVGRN